MNILVNGSPHNVADIDPPINIVAVLNELGYGGAVVATALNGEFIPHNLRAQTHVVAGDRLEIVAPMQGG